MSDEIIKYTTPSKTSRYKNLTVFKNNTNIFMDNPKYISVPSHPDDQFFSVTQKYVDRIDLISHKFYNESKLWWVIALANDLTNPFEISLDTILRIPAISTIYGAGGLVGNG